MGIVVVPGMERIGLGNILFQVAFALHYKVLYGFDIYLVDNEAVLYGTASMYDRSRTRRIGGKRVSYKETLFSKFRFHFEREPWMPFQRIHFDYGHHDPFLIPPSDFMVITGFCQHWSMVSGVVPHLPKYFDLSLDNPECVHIIQKYKIDPSQRNIMVGIRQGEDFSKKKIAMGSYKKALEFLDSSRESPSETTTTLLVVADTYSSSMEDFVEGERDGVRVVWVDEDDISQIYAGLLCQEMILSPSTFHYWIAVFRWSIDPTSRIVYFHGTDIADHELQCPEWIGIDP